MDDTAIRHLPHQRGVTAPDQRSEAVSQAVQMICRISLILMLLAVGCSAGGRSGGSGIVTATGRIGKLHVDRSTWAAVVDFAGRPDAERRGHESGFAPYHALGFGCSHKKTVTTFPLAAGGPYCRTIFFLNGETGRLETFFTTSARYSERHGVRIGMPTAAVDRLLHRRLVVGCETNLHLHTGKASLTIALTGAVEHRHVSVTGGHVYALVLHSLRSEPGVFDCI